MINPGGLLLTGMFLISLIDGNDLPQAERQFDFVRMQTLRSHGCERTNDDDPGGKGCCVVIPNGQRTRTWRGGFVSE